MKHSLKLLLGLAVLCIPACATVQILSLNPSSPSPKILGTSITWTATATDTHTGPLTFQFNVAPPGGNFTNGLAKDFNVGTLNAGTWTSQPFVWVPTIVEGSYQIQVVIKDFASGEKTSKTVTYQITPLATGTTAVVVATAHPLVALFAAPACPVGSMKRVTFQQQSKATPPTSTNWVNCRATGTMNFEIAGMYPSTTYQMYGQLNTGGTITNGATLTFTTKPLPTNFTFPTFTTIVPPGSQADTALKTVLRDVTGTGAGYAVATDLSGKINWYYISSASPLNTIVTRPLVNGGLLSIQSGLAWNPKSQALQILRQTDLAGNIVRETNTGVIQQQLLALGAKALGPCNASTGTPPIGASCLGAFHHEVIQTLPNGYTAVLADVEQIFPAGTQGDTSGLPVDIVGDAVIVLNQNWQVVWYFNAFQHASGGSQFDINRPAVLNETCVVGQSGCPPMFLLGPGISTRAKDWLHDNSLYYWPTDNAGGASGDILMSCRHQDWIVKIDYNNGTGTKNILWRLGPDGDFTFNNITSDPWPWFSHQHEAAIESTGVLTLFDNGNERVAALGNPGCLPHDCNSRGMALTINESSKQVTPVLNADLGYYSVAEGSAQFLPNGNYFFMPSVVVSGNKLVSYTMEILPTAGMDTGTVVFNLESTQGYRSWQMTSLYSPPTI